MGDARLTGPEGSLGRLERKTAALLVYLALEGPTSRARLASLLWPESPESVARNNLVHLLRRLRRATAADLVDTQDLISLTDALEVDVQRACVLYAQGEYAERAQLEGPLLPGLDYDDCPDLEDWLYATRERLEAQLLESLRREGARLEARGDYAGATRWNERLLQHDPLSEDGHRRRMRLLYLEGDRSGALRAFEVCRERLQRELGVGPHPETEALARQIEASGPLNAPKKSTALPLTALRPPLLIGREEIWARMEQAWTAGQHIYLSGEPGVGKTRLATDFAASRGEVLRLGGRPGDAGVPYATLARALRSVWTPALQRELPSWVRQELARIVPELLSDETPPIGLGETERRRLFEAAARALRGVAGPTHTLLIDDLHYFDPASWEQLMYTLSEFSSSGPAAPRCVLCYREAELPAAWMQQIRQQLGAYEAQHFVIDPLPPATMSKLIDSLELSEIADRSGDLITLSGGNPFYLLENVRHLLEAERDVALGEVGGLGSVVERRLRRLSAPALQVARAAAVLGSDACPEFAAEVLGLPLLDLSLIWQELEGYGVLQRDRFAHDLILEAVMRGLPDSMRTLLQRAAARVLERHQAPAARVGQLWEQAGDLTRAAPKLREAARVAEAALRLHEAAEFCARAAEAYRECDPDARYEALERLVVLRGSLNDHELHQQALRALFEAARGPRQQAGAWLLQNEYHLSLGQARQAEEAARQGSALPHGSTTLEANLKAGLGAALWLQGRLEEAAGALREAVSQLEELGESQDLAANTANLAVILDHLGHYPEAAARHRQACLLLEQVGDRFGLLVERYNLAISLLEAGQARAALEAAEAAGTLEDGLDAAMLNPARGRVTRARALAALGRYAPALNAFEQALALAETADDRQISAYRVYYAELLLDLAQPQRATALLAEALAQPELPQRLRPRARVSMARGQLEQGATETRASLERAAAEEPRTPFNRLTLELLQARLDSPEQALLRLEQTLEAARHHGLEGHLRSAAVLRARALRELGRTDEARACARMARTELLRCEPQGLSGWALRWMLAELLESLEDDAAEPARQDARAWTLEAVRGLPAPMMSALLARTPLAAEVASGGMSVLMLPE